MDRDDEIRYLQDKMAECRRDLTASIDAQRNISDRPSFDEYLATIRRLDADHVRFATLLEQRTGIRQQKRV